MYKASVSPDFVKQIMPYLTFETEAYLNSI
jgi:hypothetical protein